MIPTQDIRPKTTWFWVGGGLIVFGVIVAIVVFVAAFQEPLDKYREIGDKIDTFQRFRVPGEAQVNLDDPGDYVIYVEGQDSSFGQIELDPAAVTVQSVEPDSTPIPVRTVPLTETFNFDGPSEQTSLEFTITEPGVYRVAVEDAPLEVSSVAVGPPLDIAGALKATFVAFLVPTGAGGVFVISGGVLIIATAVRRSGARRRLRAANPPPPGGWGGGHPGYTPPGYAPPSYPQPGYPQPPGAYPQQPPPPPPAPAAWPPANWPPPDAPPPP